MGSGRVIKVALGLPWYSGPDRDCAANFLAFSHYLGRLQERLWWLKHGLGHRAAMMPPLDPGNSTGRSEVPLASPERIPEFEFGIIEMVGCSLVGMAREQIVDAALEQGYDYILWSDSDMMFGTDIFLRLFLADKDVVAALAFTGREPIHPVIFKFNRKYDQARHQVDVDVQPVQDYERDKLQKVDAVGSGVFLVKTEVFRRIPKPWFTSTGCGEDIFFAFRCSKYDVEIWVDTSAKTIHKPTFHREWHDELKWLRERGESK